VAHDWYGFAIKEIKSGNPFLQKRFPNLISLKADRYCVSPDEAWSFDENAGVRPEFREVLSLPNAAREGNVNVCYSAGPMRRVSGMLFKAFSKTAHISFRKFSRELPSLYALSCWALILPILLLMISGCGRHKEELENAKQQIEKLNSEVKRLTEEITRLTQEKSRLSDATNTLSDKNTQMQKEMDKLSKSRGVLSTENKELNNKYSSLEQKLASLKREKDRLTKDFEECRKKVAEVVPTTKPLSTQPPGIEPQTSKPQEALSPCDQVLAFMKASEGIVRQHKGTERTLLLDRAKEEYAPKMKGAPEKAIKAAEDWVKEGSKFWDELADDSTFRLLQLRNTVLEACGKSPGGGGFK
jgi:hypothetical protein